MVYDVFRSEDFSYTAEVDEFCQLVLHMEVTNWSPSILRRMQKVAKEGMEEFKNQGFTTAYCMTDNPKLVQLVCTGEAHGTVEYEEKEYEVILWVL